MPPALQQDDMNNGGIIYELPIAQVRITKGKAYIDSTQITDDRSFCDLQGQTGLYAKTIRCKMVPNYLNYWSDMMVSDYRNPLRYWVDGYGVYHVEGTCGGGVYGTNKDICKLPVGPSKAQGYLHGVLMESAILIFTSRRILTIYKYFSETSTVIIPEFCFRPSRL